MSYRDMSWDEIVQEAGELFELGGLSVEEIVEELGYTPGPDNTQTVLDYVEEYQENQAQQEQNPEPGDD